MCTYPLWQPDVAMGLCEMVHCRIMMSYLSENKTEETNISKTMFYAPDMCHLMCQQSSQ